MPAEVEAAEAFYPKMITATSIGGGTRNVQGLPILTNHRPSTNGDLREAEVLAGSLLLPDNLTRAP